MQTSQSEPVFVPEDESNLASELGPPALFKSLSNFEEENGDTKSVVTTGGESYNTELANIMDEKPPSATSEYYSEELGEGEEEEGEDIVNGMVIVGSTPIDNHNREDAGSVATGVTERTENTHQSSTSSYRATLNEPNVLDDEEMVLIAKVNCGELNVFDAARRNDVENIRKILKIFPELVNRKDWGNCTALTLACMLRSHEAADVLIQLGASAKFVDPVGKTPLMHIKDPKKRQYLQRQANKYDPEGDYLDDDSTVQGDTNEFRGAAYDGEMLKMSEMLGRKPDLLMSTDKKGTTALHFAVMGKNWDCCYYLLERGADLYAKTDFGTDALGFIHNDKVQMNKIKVFAYKCSARGRAEASAVFSRRKVEKKEAVVDQTYNIMADLREVILRREEQIMDKARLLSEFASDWAINHYIEMGSVNAYQHEMECFRFLREEQGREAETNIAMQEEEREMHHYNFVQHQLELRRIEREDAERLALEADAVAAAEAARLEKERMLAEAELEKIRRKNEVAYKKAEAQALQEWEILQQEERRQDWIKHCEGKPDRLKLYQRMRFAVTTTSVTGTRGDFLPRDHDNGIPKILTQKAKRPVVNLGKAKKMDTYINMKVLSDEERDKVEAVGASGHIPENSKTSNSISISNQ